MSFNIFKKERVIRPLTMVMGLKPIFLFISVFFGFLSSAYAVDNQPILVSVGQGNPPFMYRENNRVAGIYPSLIAAVFERMGVGVQVTAYPWKRALKMCQDGVAGVGGIYKTRERLAVFDYSDPLYTETVLVYVRRDNLFRFESFSDLKGKTIGVIHGWSYGDAFDRFREKENLVIKAGVNDHVTFKRLLNGDIECLFSLEQTGKLILRQAGLETQVVPLPKPLSVNQTYLVFAKKSNRNVLLRKFNATLDEMKKNGSYRRLIQGIVSNDH